MAERASISDVRAALAAASGRRLARLLRDLEDDDRAGVRQACATAASRLRAERAEASRLKRLYEVEDGLRAQGRSVLVGIDEVGRGALAGPLTAAAVVLPATPHIEGLDDSKKLTPERREHIAEQIRGIAVVCVAHVPARDLDALGMTAALRRAMREALAGCGVEPDDVLVDGLPMGVHPAETSFVKGDSRVAAIAAASVVAKVERDGLMRQAGAEFPGYGFELHKGYSTPEHILAIDQLGLTELHRRSFAPCGGTLQLF